MDDSETRDIRKPGVQTCSMVFLNGSQSRRLPPKFLSLNIFRMFSTPLFSSLVPLHEVLLRPARPHPPTFNVMLSVVE
jgi:hypothetical protein